MPKKFSRKLFKKKSRKLRRKTQKRNKKKMRGGSSRSRSPPKRSPGSRSRSPPRRSPGSRSRSPNSNMSPDDRRMSPGRRRMSPGRRRMSPDDRRRMSPDDERSIRGAYNETKLRLTMEDVYQKISEKIDTVDKSKLVSLKQMAKKVLYQKVFSQQFEQMISNPDKLVAELIPDGTEDKYEGPEFDKARAYISFCRRFSEFNTHEDFLKGLGNIVGPESQQEHNERARDGYLTVELVWGLRQDVGRSLGNSKILDKIQSKKIRGDLLKSRKLFFLYYTVLYLIFILGFNQDDAKKQAKKLMKQNQKEIIEKAKYILGLNDDRIKTLAEELMVDDINIEVLSTE